MPIYDGVVAFDDTTLIPVIVGIEEDLVRLSADGTEIGAWTEGECTIADEGDGVFMISAEDETLRFLPRDPGSFAAAVNGGIGDTSTISDHEEPSSPSDSEGAPEPKRITKVLFYLLATMTALLGVWALLSLFLF
ncbi:MAG: hypothetical protein ACE5F5_09615 [Acidimicrobiia bacterium]